MKLQQLRYVWEVVRNELNISATAESLYTSQPGISKQIRLLEEELGLQLFLRNGKHLVGITHVGEKILETIGRIISDVENIKRLSNEFNDQQHGELTIATTHTQARYVLPPVISAFMKKYPEVTLHMHQGTPMQISELAADRQVDFAIATEALELFEDLIMLPCYRWNRSIVVPLGHPLTTEKSLTLRAIAQFPIVTYVFGFTGRSQLDQAFADEHLQPRVVLTAVDADVIKTYVKLGLGVGIIASMAYDPRIDTEICALDASHLFEYSVTKIGFRKGMLLRNFMYDFIQLFAPHLNYQVVQQAMTIKSREERDILFRDIELPLH